MGRKQVLVQLDDELIEALDQAATAEGTNRSDVIRRAARAWLVARQEARWDREHEAAYARAPEDPELIESLTRMAARALAAEEPPPYRA